MIDETPLTVSDVRRIVKTELQKFDIQYSKIKARTVSFQDLARASRVFVDVHVTQGSVATEALEYIQFVAKQNKFFVHFHGSL